MTQYRSNPDQSVIVLTPRQEANFRRRVEHPVGPLGKWGCWTWAGQKHKRKALIYGSFSYTSTGRQRKVSAHRLMWQLVNGPIPDGLMVLHKCDNPLCVRPGHLYLGTAADNTADMLSRGRAGGKLPPHGKLSEADVVEIRRLWAGELGRRTQGHRRALTMMELGARYGVSEVMIHHIVHGKWWKDV